MSDEFGDLARRDAAVERQGDVGGQLGRLVARDQRRERDEAAVPRRKIRATPQPPQQSLLPVPLKGRGHGPHLAARQRGWGSACVRHGVGSSGLGQGWSDQGEGNGRRRRQEPRLPRGLAARCVGTRGIHHRSPPVLIRSGPVAARGTRDAPAARGALQEPRRGNGRREHDWGAGAEAKGEQDEWVTGASRAAGPSRTPWRGRSSRLVRPSRRLSRRRGRRCRA